MASFHELVILYKINIPKLLYQLLIEINFVIINSKIHKTTQFQAEFFLKK